MDPLGVADAVLALALYPGGLLLLALGWGASRVAGFAGRWTPNAREVAVLVVLDAAVASAPLPGSLVTSLPPAAGAAPNLVVVAVLVAAAAALAAPERWTPRPILTGLMAVAAVTALAVGAASLSLPAIVGQPGIAMQAARAAAAAAMLVAAPIVAGSRRLSPPGRATVIAGLGLLGLSLAVPPVSGGGEAAVTAASVVVVSALYAACVQRWRAAMVRAQSQLSVLTGLLCAAAIAAVTVAGRV